MIVHTLRDRVFLSQLTALLLSAFASAMVDAAEPGATSGSPTNRQPAVQLESSLDERRLPNIVFILADDAGYGDFGCYGGTKLLTPRIDQLAAGGLRFTQFYAGCTVCAPSRCVLLTGMHTGHCRVRGNGPGTMEQGDITLAHILKKRGYWTSCVGKWGLGNPPPDDDPARNGFDSFYGYVNMFHAHNFYPEFLIRDGKRVPLKNVAGPKWKTQDGRGIAETRVDYVPDLLADEVLSQIETRSKTPDQPFLIYYALNVPHANNEAGASTRPERGMEVPDFGPFADESWPGPEKGFASIMRNLDRDVGRIVDKLRETGLDRTTLILFSSDNGPHHEGGHDVDFFDSNGELRGSKRDLYEGGIRVPLIAYWPGHIDPGTETSHISGFQDVLPTFSELVQAPEQERLDGISFLPTLLGETTRQRQHEFLYWEFGEQGGKQAVRAGDWKLVQLNVSSHRPASPELYNLKSDLQEANNVAAEHPEIVKSLLQLVEQAHKPHPGYPLLPTEK